MKLASSLTGVRRRKKARRKEGELIPLCTEQLVVMDKDRQMFWDTK